MNKFKIGQEIDGGIIVSIIDGQYMFEYYFKNDETQSEPWDKTYPGWRSKPVYNIKFKDPRKILTFEEFKKQNWFIKDEYLKEMYDTLCPIRFDLMIPEDNIAI